MRGTRAPSMKSGGETIPFNGLLKNSRQFGPMKEFNTAGLRQKWLSPHPRDPLVAWRIKDTEDENSCSKGWDVYKCHNALQMRRWTRATAKQWVDWVIHLDGGKMQRPWVGVWMGIWTGEGGGRMNTKLAYKTTLLKIQSGTKFDGRTITPIPLSIVLRAKPILGTSDSMSPPPRF